MKTIGYYHLISQYGLQVCKPRIHSYIWEHSQKKEKIFNARVECYYPSRQWRDKGDDWKDHLEFAFKYEGLNFEVLSAFFEKVDRDEISDAVRLQPWGGFSRRLWFAYEFLTGELLNLDDLASGNYVDLLDGDLQVVVKGVSVRREKRYRILNNMLGTRTFCPMVYRTPALSAAEEDRLKDEAKRIIDSYPADVIYRAIQFLFVKETRSSFAIEHESPDQRRTNAFVELLRNVHRCDELTQENLIAWQNQIVDKRYQATSWRSDQVYVGETLSPMREFIHYIAPKPEDLPEIMDGWLECAEKLLLCDGDALIATAVLSFAFVFIHPFDDGNGRLHRLLMHYLLARKKFIADGFIFPVSAVLIKNPSLYDSLLESFSREVMLLLDYETNDLGEVCVKNDTIRHYRYVDYTFIVEKFIGVIRETMEKEWKSELVFLQNYDQARARMRDVADMPEKKTNQFICFVLQNSGKLSKGKRSFFAELSDVEVARLEEIINSAFAHGKEAE